MIDLLLRALGANVFNEGTRAILQWASGPESHVVWC